jgi:hypothetical protein
MMVYDSLMTLPLPLLSREDEYLRIIKVFYRKTRGSIVSSDTFRSLSLDNYLPTMHRNGIGKLFMLAVTGGYLEEVGRIPSAFKSTHGRKIGQYRWTKKASKSWAKEEST